jgi:hypothetical protein
MRFTQLGHHVPRRNSTMAGPRFSTPDKEAVTG